MNGNKKLQNFTAKVRRLYGGRLVSRDSPSEKSRVWTTAYILFVPVECNDDSV